MVIGTNDFFLHPEVKEIIELRGLEAIDAFEVAWKSDDGQAIIYHPDVDLWLYYSPQTFWQRVYASDSEERSKTLRQKFRLRHLCTASAYGSSWEFFIDQRD